MDYRGMKIVENSVLMPVARVTLSNDLKYISEHFRMCFNSWLAERFGVQDPVYVVDSNIFSLTGEGNGEKIIMTTPAMAKEIKQALNNKED